MSNQSGWLFSGANAVEVAARENEAARQRQQRRGAQRFSVPLDKETGKGTSAEIVFLDKHYNETFALYEYAIPGPSGKWSDTTFEVSCENFREMSDPLAGQIVNGQTLKSYYIQVYSILDLRPYVNKQGKVIPYTRKMLCVKRTQITEIVELLEKLIKVNGTLRGTHIKMRRGETNTSSSIGSPQVLDDTLTYGFFTEQQLIQKFGHPEVKSQDGRVIIPANGQLAPYNYLDYFKKPDPDEQRRRYGLSMPMGSRYEGSSNGWGQAIEEGIKTETSEKVESESDQAMVLNAEDLIEFAD